MTTSTVTPRKATVRVCAVCEMPASDTQSLVYEMGGIYVHPRCSDRSEEYVICEQVSFPDEQELGDLPPASASTRPALGFELCPDCEGLAYPFQPDELCPTCQEAANEYEGGRYDGPPEYEPGYRRLTHAERGRLGGEALVKKVDPLYFSFIGRRGARVHVYRFWLSLAAEEKDEELRADLLQRAENYRDELHNRVMLDLWAPSEFASAQKKSQRRPAQTDEARWRRWEKAVQIA